MLPAIYAVLMVVLIIVALQDFRERRIYWLLVPSAFLLFFLSSVKTVGIAEGIKFSLYNALFFILQLILIFLYYLIKHRELTNIINRYLGLGDVLFVLAICPAFSPANFILFYLAGLILALATFFVLGLIQRDKNKEIPLAGVLSIALLFLLSYRFINKEFNLYNDEQSLIALFHWTDLNTYR